MSLLLAFLLLVLFQSHASHAFIALSGHRICWIPQRPSPPPFRRGVAGMPVPHLLSSFSVTTPHHPRTFASRLQALSRRLQPNLLRPFQTSLQQQQQSTSSSSSTSSPDLFDWSTEWYPVSPVCDLSTTQPNRITLLGKDFCVWFQSQQQTWQAFEDSCPHRMVPLSEGRLEDGVLQCAYHGWEFNDNGTCVNIPQLSSTFTPSMAACAKKFPTQVVQDLLWIFPSHDQTELAALKSPATIPQLDDEDKVDATALFCRDLPYSWQVLVENLCDPTHVVYAHHGFMRGADRYDNDSKNMQVNLRVTSSDKTGFVADKEPLPINGRYQVRFQPPCLLYYDIVNSRAMGSSLNEEQQSQVYVGLGNYCIPTGPQSSRLIARFPFYLPVKPIMTVMKYTPRWITHFAQNIVIDSDVVFLATQDERLQQLQQQGEVTLNHYYLPARSDAMVVAFRKWLQSYGSPTWLGIPAARSHGNGDPTEWKPVPARFGRDALLDRYRQHTHVCSSCRTAHKWLRRWSHMLTWSSLFMLAVTSSGIVIPPLRKRWVASMLSLVLLAIPRVALRPLIQRMECVPWPRTQWLQSPATTTSPTKKEIRI